MSISTGRESLLIGPSSAFGAKTRNLVIRDRIRLRHALDIFMTRPGAIALLRPNLRRWGIAAAHSYLDERDAIKDALSRAIASGRLAIAIIPEVTMAFSKVHATAGQTLTLAIPAPAIASKLFPDGMQDRLVLVIEKVPAHMTGATRQAFEDALANTGVGIIVGGLMTWVGAHLIPGVNVAVLAFDLFFLGSDVIRACETIGATLDDIAKAKSHEDLEPAAKVIAGAIAVLLVAGIFSRLMKAKQVTKGPAKNGGRRSVEKPGGGPKERRKVRDPRKATEPANNMGDETPPKRNKIPETPSRRIHGLASTLSVKTPKNKSIFYSGPGNREKALAAANKDDFVPIDNTECGRALDGEKLYNKFNPLYSEANQHWSTASKRYAEGASGHVTAYVDGASTQGVFYQTELPVLLRNENVDSINGVPKELLLQLETESPGSAFQAVTGQAPL